MRTKLGLIAIFVAGVLTGSALMMVCQLRFGPPGPRGDKHVEKMLSHMKRELNLTAEQETSVRRILRQSHQEMKNAWCSLKPKFESLREETSGKIRAVLTTDQLSKFESIEKKMK